MANEAKIIITVIGIAKLSDKVMEVADKIDKTFI